jgi:hypothetical protein
LERRLGIRANDRKRRKLHQAVEDEGFGRGFMAFLDSIDHKLKEGNDYEPEEYEFSDG